MPAVRELAAGAFGVVEKILLPGPDGNEVPMARKIIGKAEQNWFTETTNYERLAGNPAAIQVRAPKTVNPDLSIHEHETMS